MISTHVDFCSKWSLLASGGSGPAAGLFECSAPMMSSDPESEVSGVSGDVIINVYGGVHTATVGHTNCHSISTEIIARCTRNRQSTRFQEPPFPTLFSSTE